MQIAWPGLQTNAAHSWGGEQPDIRVWYGGLVDGMRDASGQMYMRNRYYDPATGQFTQTDPIGIAGGLNVYGFAAGDPVSYSDPYGLCTPWPSCLVTRSAEDAVQHWADQAENSTGVERKANQLMGLLASLGTEDNYRATAATLSVAGSLSTLARNKQIGDGFRDFVAASMERLGYGVEVEVTMRTPFGPRRVDIQVSDNGIVIGNIETKTGRSRYLPEQQRKDQWIHANFGIGTVVVRPIEH